MGPVADELEAGEYGGAGAGTTLVPLEMAGIGIGDGAEEALGPLGFAGVTGEPDPGTAGATCQSDPLGTYSGPTISGPTVSGPYQVPFDQVPPAPTPFGPAPFDHAPLFGPGWGLGCIGKLFPSGGNENSSF